MSKDVLQLLFDSKARVKILKLLFRNSGQKFNIREIAARAQERPSVVRREIKKLVAAGLLNIVRNDK